MARAHQNRALEVDRERVSVFPRLCQSSSAPAPVQGSPVPPRNAHERALRGSEEKISVPLDAQSSATRTFNDADEERQDLQRDLPRLQLFVVRKDIQFAAGCLIIPERCRGPAIPQPAAVVCRRCRQFCHGPRRQDRGGSKRTELHGTARTHRPSDLQGLNCLAW